MFMKLIFFFQLYEEDGLPNFICDICFEKLNNAVEFKKQLETINEVLKQYVNNLRTPKKNGLKPGNDTKPEILNKCNSMCHGLF